MSKTQLTNILAKGSPNLEAKVLAAAMVPGSLAVPDGSGGLTTPGSGAFWAGDIILPQDDLGQGYSGVFATDSASGNAYASGDKALAAIVGVGDEFLAWAKAETGDISEGDLLVMLTGDNAGLVQEAVDYGANVGQGYAIAVAMEDLAISGITVHTPIKCRRIMGRLALEPKVYRALLAPSATNAPAATVLENTIGDIVWGSDGVSIFLATLAGAFPVDKVFMSCSLIETGATPAYINSFMVRNSDDELAIHANFGQGQEDLFYGWVEILVYP